MSEPKRSFPVFRAVAASVALFAGTMPALAQDSFTWTVQTGYSAGDDLHQTFVELGNKIEAMSGGRLVLEVAPGGAFVPSFDVLDAVDQGVLDAAGGDGDYWVGKHPAGSLFASSPGFGMQSIDLMGWMEYGGGKELFTQYITDTLQMTNTVPFLISPAQAQPFGWFEEPVMSLADVEGLKFRTPGLPVDVMRELGASVITMPGSEVVPALEQGVIEAAEYFSPKADLILGLPDVRKTYMMPSYLQIGLVQNFFINAERWEELPDDLKAIVTYAVMAESADFYWRGLDENSKALAELETEMGVTVVETPREIMEAQLAAWEVVLARYAAEDEFFSSVLDSQRAFASRAVALKARINPPLDVALDVYGFGEGSAGQ